MFSRRTIQALIAESAKTMSCEQLTEVVGRLNRTDPVAIEMTWELIWIAALARCGRVVHEPRLPGGTGLPDIHFRSDNLEFIADVAAVSDAGYEKDNPVEELRTELQKLYAKHRLGAGFAVKYEAKHVGVYRDNKVKLLIPARGEMTEFIKKHFGPYVREVALAPEKKKAAVTADVPGGGTIVLDYDPARSNNHECGHLSFDVPYSLTQNPVNNVLKAKKRQLARSGFAGPQGVILCDCDCSMLTRNLYNPSGFTLDEIVWDFLRQNTSVGFVLKIGVATETGGFGVNRWVTKIKPKLFTQVNMDEKIARTLMQVLNKALKEVPTPKCSPLNAKARLELGSPPPAQFSDGFRKWSLSGRLMEKAEITISARSLTALLGGEIDLETFRSLHLIPTNNGAAPIAPLQRAIKEGRQLESISLRKVVGEDDDSVTFCFGASDPAKVKFRVPDQQ